MSPTQRTIRALKDMGRICGIVERFNPHVGSHGIRQDFLGIIDIISLEPNERGIVGVQSCGSSFLEHDKKIMDTPETVEWLKAGGRLELWGWRKIKWKRGSARMTWAPRIKEYLLEDFQ